MLSFSFALLPLACAIFHYIFDYLLFLRPHVVPRREHTHLFHDGCSAVPVASHAHTHTYTQSYSAYVRKVVVVVIGIISVSVTGLGRRSRVLCER